MIIIGKKNNRQHTIIIKGTEERSNREARGNGGKAPEHRADLTTCTEAAIAIEKKDRDRAAKNQRLKWERETRKE